MKFSIVIPAYNEEESIGNVVKVLSSQTVDRNDFEIIVVDNNSADRTGETAKEAGADLVVKELKAGTNMARQAGLVAAKGEIVAFLDADCRPPTNWLEKIAKDLSRPGVAAVSGPYDYGFGWPFSWLDKLNSALFSIADKLLFFFYGKKAGIAIGGNFAAKRETLLSVGGMPPLRFFGDDATIANVIARKKGKVFFDPKLVVKSSGRRMQSEGILKLAGIYRKAFMKVYFLVDRDGNYDLQLLQNELDSFLKHLKQGVW